MTGEEAHAAFTQAAALVKSGKFDEARAVNLLPSDRTVIEERIAAATKNASAKYTKHDFS